MLYPQLQDLIKLRQVVQRAIEGSRYRHHNNMQGDYTSILHGLGVEFETIRPYVVGDDVRYIDWRTTARIGKPQVKTFRSECDRNVFVVVDANAYMRFGTRGTFKSIQAARAAAIMSWASLQQQDRVGGLIFGDVPGGIQYFKPTKTHLATLRLLHSLCSEKTAQHEPVSITNALQDLSRLITPQSVVVIVSDFSVESLKDLQHAFLSLRKVCNVMLLPIYDPSDVEIPDTGALLCVNDKHQQIIYTSNKQARQKYQNLWREHKEGLDRIAKKMRMPIVWLETTMDPVRALWRN